MNTSTKTLCLLVALAAAGVAQADTKMNGGSTQIQDKGTPVTVTWGQSEQLPNADQYAVTVADLDSNHDGKISRAEARSNSALTSEWKLVDRNHDGYITAAELANWH